MTRETSTLLAHELIGLRVTVQSAFDAGLIGTQGVVRDETKNMLHVMSGNRTLKLPKHGTWFQFELSSDEKPVLHGDRLSFRPEDRVKRGL